MVDEWQAFLARNPPGPNNSQTQKKSAARWRRRHEEWKRQKKAGKFRDAGRALPEKTETTEAVVDTPAMNTRSRVCRANPAVDSGVGDDENDSIVKQEPGASSLDIPDPSAAHESISNETPGSKLAHPNTQNSSKKKGKR